MADIKIKMLEHQLALIETPYQWDEQTCASIQATLSKIEDDVEGVILCGGTEHFCGGLKPEASKAKIVAATETLVKKIETCPKPIVACLYGEVLGIGYEIAKACPEKTVLKEKTDMRYDAVKQGFYPVSELVLKETFTLYEMAQTPASLDMVPQFKALLNAICFAKPVKGLRPVEQEDKALAIQSAITLLEKGVAHAETSQVDDKPYSAMGTTGLAALDVMLMNMLYGDFIKKEVYDFAKNMANFMCGGDVPRGTPIKRETLKQLYGAMCRQSISIEKDM